jgi:hypothetical protein
MITLQADQLLSEHTTNNLLTSDIQVVEQIKLACVT